jgi:DNA-binding transcriptional MocR family regulator
MKLCNSNTQDLEGLRADLRARYDGMCRHPFNINLTRGVPATEQLDLVTDLLALPGPFDWRAEDGTDCRNYGGLGGIPEARRLFASMIDADPEALLVGGNSSLALMHDWIMFAMAHGTCDSQGPWSRGETISFLCPVPGYDRHFAICESFGIQMIAVPMLNDGPDMDVVEKLVASDERIKGIWCVPKYSNPTGVTYCPATIERLAAMKTAAKDFRLFWDNAYAVHHLTTEQTEIGDIIARCRNFGHRNRPLVFSSTSKITLPGAGLALFASSRPNIDWYFSHLQFQTIGPDKLNQLRHVRFLRDLDGIHNLMERHRTIIAPKFERVHETFAKILEPWGVAEWSRPKGGYFISLDVPDGCAARVVALCKDLGVELTPAGATYPQRYDPRDCNIRIAPTFPSLADIARAAEAVATCVLLAAADSVLGVRRLRA